MTRETYMGENDEPVIEDPALPMMDGTAVADELGEFEVEADDDPELPAMGDMPDGFESEALPEMDSDGSGFEPPIRVGGDTGPAYLRLVVSTRGGAASVVGARIVDGPLAHVSTLGDLMYQVTLRGRSIGAGGLPDLRHARGSAPEEDPERGHSFRDVEGGEFVVRIPRDDVTMSDLRDLQIQLVAPDTVTLQLAPGQTVQEGLIEEGFDVPEVIAELTGIDPETLPEADLTDLQNRLRS